MSTGEFAFENMKMGLAQVIESKGYDLAERLPRGFINEMVGQFSAAKNDIKYALTLLRQERGVIIKRKSRVKKLKKNKFLEVCREYGFMRSSKKEGVACEAICKHLIYNVPHSGHSLLIGTPTPWCASDLGTYNNTIIDDNDMVAKTMKLTSSSMTIAIGNSVDSEKADRKADCWNRMSTMKDVEVITEPIHRDSFNRLVTRYADKNQICKVVLLTSGTWRGCKKSYDKHELDLNFESPSIYLTRMYPNLHILALVRTSNYVFSVKYVHGGEVEDVYG
jgi:hypothetical protein